MYTTLIWANSLPYNLFCHLAARGWKWALLGWTWGACREFWGVSGDPCARGWDLTTLGMELRSRRSWTGVGSCLKCAKAVAGELMAQGKLQLTVFQVKHNKL